MLKSTTKWALPSSSVYSLHGDSFSKYVSVVLTISPGSDPCWRDCELIIIFIFSPTWISHHLLLLALSSVCPPLPLPLPSSLSSPPSMRLPIPSLPPMKTKASPLLSTYQLFYFLHTVHAHATFWTLSADSISPSWTLLQQSRATIYVHACIYLAHICAQLMRHCLW